MKELSIEQKAKAYDEAIRKAKITLGCCNSASIITEHTIYDIFPELKEENEDEEVIETLIEFFKNYKTQEEIGIRTFFGTPTDNIIAWLEKQKWKPSDIRIKALKIVKDYVISNNWNDCVCNALKNLLEQLKKL